MIFDQKIECVNVPLYKKVRLSCLIATIVITIAGIVLWNINSKSYLNEVVLSISIFVLMLMTIIYMASLGLVFFKYKAEIEYYNDKVVISQKNKKEIICFSEVSDVEYKPLGILLRKGRAIVLRYGYSLTVSMKNQKPMSIFVYQTDIPEFKYCMLYNLYLALTVHYPFKNSESSYIGGTLKHIDLIGDLNGRAWNNKAVLEQRMAPIKFEFEAGYLLVTNSDTILSFPYSDISCVFHSKPDMQVGRRNNSVYFIPAYVKIMTYSGQGMVVRLTDEMDFQYSKSSDNISILIDELNYRIEKSHERLLSENMIQH